MIMISTRFPNITIRTLVIHVLCPEAMFDGLGAGTVWLVVPSSPHMLRSTSTSALANAFSIVVTLYVFQ